MARGESGRIVLEIDPSQKNELYLALARDGLTLKDWFLQQTFRYLRERSQLSLFGSLAAEEKAPLYRTKSESSPEVLPVVEKRHRRKPKVG